jgi:hypothetical protein
VRTTGLPDAAVPLVSIANLSWSNSKGKVKIKGGLDTDEVDDDNVVCILTIWLSTSVNCELIIVI